MRETIREHIVNYFNPISCQTNWISFRLQCIRIPQIIHCNSFDKAVPMLIQGESSDMFNEWWYCWWREWTFSSVEFSFRFFFLLTGRISFRRIKVNHLLIFNNDTLKQRNVDICWIHMVYAEVCTLNAYNMEVIVNEEDEFKWTRTDHV